MREFTQMVYPADAHDIGTDVELVLDFEQRQKSRQAAKLSSGEKIGIFLAHGQRLMPRAKLVATDGSEIWVRAATQAVSTIRATDPLKLTRAAYHLGNRHVPVQIGDGWIRYEPDHVLDEMLVGLGFDPIFEQAPFEPEQGAYSSHAHHHHHD
ncbi:MAG: urease accessory protein UreE [Pseudomonadota bacterium]